MYRLQNNRKEWGQAICPKKVATFFGILRGSFLLQIEIGQVERLEEGNEDNRKLNH
jgi:hypothetical protein